MKNTFFSCLITLLGLGLAGTSAMAQAPPAGALGQGQVGAQTAQRPLGLGAAGAQKLSLKDLGNELLLLQGTDHFYSHLSLGATYNTNALYDFREQGDWSMESAFDLGARTVLGGSFYVDTAFLWTNSSYDKFTSLSHNTLGGKATMGGMLGPVPFGLSWQGNWWFDNSFKSEDLNFQVLSMSVPVYTGSLGSRTALTVSPYFNWVKSHPSTYDQIVPGLAVGVSSKVSDKVTVGLNVLEGYSHYQHYLPGIFDKDRNDWNTTVVLSAKYQFNKYFEARLDARFSNNSSNLKGLDLASGNLVNLYSYNAWLFTPTLALTYTF